MDEICSIDRVIGAKVRSARMAEGFELAGLAKELGISEFQLALIERGSNRIEAASMLKLCKLFNMSAQYFFDSWEIPSGSPLPSGKERGGEITSCSRNPLLALPDDCGVSLRFAGDDHETCKVV